MSARKFEIYGTKTRFGNVTVNRLGNQLTQVLLHSNSIAVINFENRTVSVNHCNWKTRTTVTAINNVLEQLSAPARSKLSLKNGRVYNTSFDGITMPFNDNGETFFF